MLTGSCDGSRCLSEYWECLALPGVRLDSQGDDDIRQKVARGHFLACLFDWWRHNSIKNVSVGFNVLTLLPIIGVLSVGFSIMSLIVIISLLTSLLLRYIADWDDKRVVLSNIFWGKWIRICKISNKHFSGDINIPVRYRCGSAANRLIGEVVQSRRRPLLGPSPGWKRLLALSHLRHY